MQPTGLGPLHLSGTQVPPSQSSVQYHVPVSGSHPQPQPSSTQVWPTGQPWAWQPTGLGPPHSAPGPLDALAPWPALLALPPSPPAPPPSGELPHAATSSESADEQQSENAIFESLITKPPAASIYGIPPAGHGPVAAPIRRSLSAVCLRVWISSPVARQGSASA
ncbi:hypothetical protein BE20_02975 [Sorangium cellulosum]|nr:hypothetical protein BE20_02975 [Sorangium cellulosum]